MKKVVFIVLSLFCCSFLAWGQYEPPLGIDRIEDYRVIDSAYLKFTYRLLSVKDTARPELTYEDRQVLQIGKRYSKYFSQYLVDYSERVARDLKSGKIKDVIENNPYKGSYGYEIFKNYPREGVLTFNDLACFKSNYTYEENIPLFAWKMTEEKDTILGYECMKANMRFRGRDYTAWFTMQIPLSSGPWKFGGLPGLILKIKDNSGHYIWECIGMEQLEKREPIRFYNVDFLKINRRDLAKLYQRYHKDQAAFNKQIGIISLAIQEDGTYEEYSHSKKELPYNPIELE